MPAEMIPEPLRAWVTDAAERLGVPNEFIAAPAICALGLVIGRQIGIHPKAKDGWLEVSVLWCILIANPSYGKSPAVKEALSLLYLLVARAREEYLQEELERTAEAEVLKAEIARLKNSLKSQKRSADPQPIKTQLTDALLALKQLDEVTERRYITNDATVEKLAELLIQNPRGIMDHADELLRLFKSLEKTGREGDRQFFLEAWSGTNPFSVDRIGRGSIHVPALFIPICGTTQQGAMQAYISEAVEGGSGADGLLQRFGPMLAPTAFPPVKVVDRTPDREAKNRVQAVFEYLDALDPQALIAELDPYRPDAVPSLRFTPEAQEAFYGWLHDLLTRIRSPELEPYPAFQSHLAKYQALMPRLSLVFHLIDVAAGANPGPISSSAADLAMGWCETSLSGTPSASTPLRSTPRVYQGTL